MRWSADVAAGDWIRPRLGGWGTVGGVVPTGFAAYARLPHRVVRQRRLPDPGSALGWRWEERPISWAVVATRLGRIAHPGMQWESITGGEREPRLGDGWSVDAPRAGCAGLELLADLAEALPDVSASFGVWSGYGGINGSSVRFSIGGDADQLQQRGLFGVDPAIASAAANGPLLELPGRDYVLLNGRVGELTEHGWPERAGLGESWAADLPNLIWAADRTWFVGTEIDFDSTLLGGPVDLVERVLQHPELEAYPVDPGTDLSAEGDRINGRPTR